MEKLIVNVKKLNKRSVIPSTLPDENNIQGIVFKNYTFDGEEITNVPNPSIGKWFKDKEGYFYWGGGVNILVTADDDAAVPSLQDTNTTSADNTTPTGKTIVTQAGITPEIKIRVQQAVNAFETGSAEGDYPEVVCYKDYKNPTDGSFSVQVTYGRPQTTEFGNLKTLVQDYVNAEGAAFAEQLRTYVNRIGNPPSLAADKDFCQALIDAGKKDPVMKTCQDAFLDREYYGPASQWFTTNGFTTPLSMLVIYDSYVHSGGILSFLLKKFLTALPTAGGNEKEWINNYVEVLQNWLANNANPLLRKTVYRTHCFQQQIFSNNWDLAQPFLANGVKI